jgi:voltage-gated potassium channel
MMNKLKEKLYEVIFEADTREGKLFDVVLLSVILFSVLLVLLESVSAIRNEFRDELVLMEWVITVIFTIEYVIRIWIVRRPWRYVFSFYGIIDFLSVIPTYLGLLIVGYQSLLIIRVLRLLRIFRILKLARYTIASSMIARALWASREKINVFIFFVILLVIIVGTLMYLIEGEANGYHSIPLSIYWAIVTLTTVGYGDIIPATALGKFLAGLIMLTGYAIIAVPTGIVTAEMIKPSEKQNTQVCSNCMHDSHDNDAAFCKKCGENLNPSETKTLKDKI